MRKRNTPIRMITVRPAQPHERTTMLALARRFGFSVAARRVGEGVTDREPQQPDGLDLDQRVRAVGEW
ncbi:short-chain dehydrogenase [uncultured Variovorax sp.]|uniref:short-chain dehydrogenase n=1 Tax=uncultured Variovorax sp. TaxID=114708 RepID=UPI0025F106AA|nr:short-chain dehydrogenase [uncultured Variovorax sp.]